jgi:hypothetical protein
MNYEELQNYTPYEPPNCKSKCTISLQQRILRKVRRLTIHQWEEIDWAIGDFSYITALFISLKKCKICGAERLVKTRAYY